MSPALLVAFLALCGPASAVSWRQCSGPAAVIEINAAALSPEPITAGAQVVFSLSGQQAPGIEVDSGTLHATVKYMGVKVFSKSGDLCSNLAAPTRCPLRPGNATLELIETMPGYLPPGKMVLRLEGTQEQQQQQRIFCVEVDLDSSKAAAVRPGPGRAATALNKLRLGVANAASSINFI